MVSRLAFNCEWYQEEASIIRNFQLCFYPEDNTIEVYDTRNKKIFLRRTRVKDLNERDFFIGSKVNIYGRQFDIVEYADIHTKTILAKYRKKAFILLKNCIMSELGAVITGIIESNIGINRAIMVAFTADMVKSFLDDKNKGDVETSVLMNQLLAGPCVGLEVIADNALEKIRCAMSNDKNNIKGKDTPLSRVLENPDIQTGIYHSLSEKDVEKDLEFFFDKKSGLEVTCRLNNSTLAVIKPHSIKAGKLGKIITEITTHGFKITALKMHLLERANCEEFYEIYRGIIPEYIAMVTQLASGSCLALEIVCDDPSKNSYEEFRNFCGPMDPEIAKLLRPRTLRATFGLDKTLNAIHCTDLRDDTVLELQYFFKILD